MKISQPDVYIKNYEIILGNIMRLLSDKPFGLRDFNFVCMGLVSDSNKDYVCLLQINTGQLYIEEVHWGKGNNIHTATLHQVDHDKEWRYLFKCVSEATTIFSPKKIKLIRKNPFLYFYNTKTGYTKSQDFIKRKRKGIA